MARRKSLRGTEEQHAEKAERLFSAAIKQFDSAKSDAQNGRCEQAFSKFADGLDLNGGGAANAYWAGKKINEATAELKMIGAEKVFKQYCINKPSSYERNNMAGKRRR